MRRIPAVSCPVSLPAVTVSPRLVVPHLPPVLFSILLRQGHREFLNNHIYHWAEEEPFTFNDQINFRGKGLADADKTNTFYDQRKIAERISQAY